MGLQARMFGLQVHSLMPQSRNTHVICRHLETASRLAPCGNSALARSRASVMISAMTLYMRCQMMMTSLCSSTHQEMNSDVVLSAFHILRASCPWVMASSYWLMMAEHLSCAIWALTWTLLRSDQDVAERILWRSFIFPAGPGD